MRFTVSDTLVAGGLLIGISEALIILIIRYIWRFITSLVIPAISIALKEKTEKSPSFWCVFHGDQGPSQLNPEDNMSVICLPNRLYMEIC